MGCSSPVPRHILFSNAGTTANVGIQLQGKSGSSFTRLLSRPGSFQRGSVDVFLVATDDPMGSIVRVQVWHDHSGRGPSWFLSYIIVQDLQNGQRFYFMADTWLSLSAPKQAFIQRELDAAGELWSISNLFLSFPPLSLSLSRSPLSVFTPSPSHTCS